MTVDFSVRCTASRATQSSISVLVVTQLASVICSGSSRKWSLLLPLASLSLQVKLTQAFSTLKFGPLFTTAVVVDAMLAARERERERERERKKEKEK